MRMPFSPGPSTKTPPTRETGFSPIIPTGSRTHPIGARGTRPGRTGVQVRADKEVA